MYAISCDLARIVPAGSKVYLPSPIAMYSEIHTPFQRYARLSIAFDPKETSYLYFDGKDRNVLDSLRKTKKYMLIDLSYGASLAVRDH